MAAQRGVRDSKVLVVGVLGNGRGRWLAVAASVAVCAAVLYAEGRETPCCKEAAPGVPATVSPTVSPPVSPTSQAPVAADAPHVASPEETAALMAAPAPAATPGLRMALPPGVASEYKLQVKTIWAARVISVLFPEITTIGGYRQDALKWHPMGLAIDVMIPNYHTPEGIDLGNQIAGYALANAKRWGVIDVIWRQVDYPGIGAPSWTADYGSETGNHYDHVHIATDGGGYPTGKEIYYIDSMVPAPPN